MRSRYARLGRYARALVVGAALIAALGVSQSRAAELPSKAQRSWLNPLLYRDFASRQVWRARHIEGVEMVLAILGGSQMGPGEGWFHASQSRYSWDWLAARYDKDRDGKITRKEFAGDDALFARLDRNRDGVISAEDFDWTERSPFLRQTGMAQQWFSLLDANSNGRISKEEWEAFFKRAAKGKDHLTAEDLIAAVTPSPSKGGSNGPSPLVLLKGLWEGELGSFQEGPSVGDRAPDFRLKTHDGKQELALGQFQGKKPVVLVFGSFT